MAKDDRFCNRAEAYEAHDDVPLSPADQDSIGDIILKRYSRRAMLRGSLGVVAAAALFGPQVLGARRARAEASEDRFAFTEIAAGVDKTHYVAEGYRAQVLLRWGDPLFPDAPVFAPHQQSAAAQLKQFGYNNDYVGFIPLGEDADRGLLCVNHEYTNEEVMFPGLKRQDTTCFPDMTAELVEIEMAAHGITIVEIVRAGDTWQPVLDSPYNRRISPLDTVITVDGPGAGHDRLKTRDDPSGTRILGTLNNCAGGITPWGTLSQLGGKPPRLFLDRRAQRMRRGSEGTGRSAGQELCPLRRAGAVAGLGQIPRPLQCRQGAKRAEPLRLDRGNRSVRPQLGAGEAYGPWPFLSRRRRDSPQSRWARGGLLRRRHAL
jgi:Alkaline phosphatase PhoX